ncbi:MAG TPA: hypothetical protein VIG74_04305 [Alphaproteobacteria bacterium]|jgi:hypothetical protein
MEAARKQLTNEFFEQVRDFAGHMLETRAAALESSLRRVTVEIAFRTAEHPLIIQYATHDEPCDQIPAGRALAEKADHLLHTVRAIDILSTAQAEIAGKKFDKLKNDLAVFRAENPETGRNEILFFPGDTADYASEIEGLPFAATRQFLKDLPVGPDYMIENITVSWQKPDEPHLRQALSGLWRQPTVMSPPLAPS